MFHDNYRNETFEVKKHPQMPFLLAEWTGHFVVQVFQIVQEQVW